MIGGIVILRSAIEPQAWQPRGYQELNGPWLGGSDSEVRRFAGSGVVFGDKKCVVRAVDWPGEISAIRNSNHIK